MRKVFLFVALVGLSLSALFSGTAFGHSGTVHLDENCNVWHARVELAHDVTPDLLVFVTTSIPGTTGILNGHYDTSYGLIWSATGSYPASGTVALVIYKPKGNSWALEFTDTEVLTAPSCGTTTTTNHVTTTTAHDNRCDVNHPGEGQDNDQGHNNPDCVSTTTTAPSATTTVTLPPTTTTTTDEPTTTTTVVESTTTTAPDPTTTVAQETTSTVAGTSSTTSSTSHGVVTTTTAPGASSTTVATPGRSVPPAVAVSLPRTGGSDSVLFQLGLVLFALGTLALAFVPRRRMR